MQRPTARTSINLPKTWEIYPQAGYDIYYQKAFSAFEGSSCGPIVLAEDGGSVFIVTGVSNEDVTTVMNSLKNV
jgi:hypothetical protein